MRKPITVITVIRKIHLENEHEEIIYLGKRYAVIFDIKKTARQVTVVAKGDGLEAGFQDGRQFLRSLKRPTSHLQQY